MPFNKLLWNCTLKNYQLHGRKRGERTLSSAFAVIDDTDSTSFVVQHNGSLVLEK